MNECPSLVTEVSFAMRPFWNFMSLRIRAGEQYDYMHVTCMCVCVCVEVLSSCSLKTLEHLTNSRDAFRFVHVGPKTYVRC